MPARYLITGVAGSGKSTLEKIFRKDGYATVDVDDGLAEWRHAKTNEPLEYKPSQADWHKVAEWVVDTDKLQSFFDDYPKRDVFVFGSFARTKTMVSRFDKIFLLEYHDNQVARQRIAGRKKGYGRNEYELALILSYIEPYQAKMRAAGAVSIDCSLPVEQVIEIIKSQTQP